MNDLSKYLGRGLLVLALSGAVFACGDDDDHHEDDDDGGVAGRSGSGGRGGRGGSGGEDEGGSGGTDGGDVVTEAECREQAEDVDAPVSAACISCLCDADAEATAECDVDCWALIACVQLACDGDPDALMCIAAECADDVGGIGNLAAVGMLSNAVPFGDCEDECPPPDVTDAGGDEDAGN